MTNIKMLAAVSLAALAFGGPASADDLKKVWGGGKVEVSAYSGTYVPLAITNLDAVRLTGYEWGGVSGGCADNLGKVTENPTHVAICQGDLVESEVNKKAFKYVVIRKDLGKECQYIATANAGYDNLGHVIGNSFDLTVHTAGPKSGMMASWMRLREIYPDLKDIKVVNHNDDREAVQAAKADAEAKKAAIAFFVKRPDPDNATFKFIAENSMKFVPVYDIDLEGKGYSFPSVTVENVGWQVVKGAKPKKVATACTDIALITGDPASLTGEANAATKKRVEATIERLRAQPASMWQPKEGWYTAMLNNLADTAPDRLAQLREQVSKTVKDLKK